MNTTIYWRDALWLWLCALPLLLWLWNRKRHKQQWRRVVDPDLLPWARSMNRPASSRLRLLSLGSGWILLCMAMAGPRTIEWIPPQYRPDPASVIFIIDLSASMNAQDVMPSRRIATQRLLEQWLNEENQTLTIATLLFAGHAFTLHPPTSDINVARFFNGQLNQLQLPTLGNHLPAAIKSAEAMWPKTESPRRLIIFTDGDMETTMQQQAAQRLKALSEQPDLQIAMIGVGNNHAVTIADNHGNLITQNAHPVLSRLQAGWMTQLQRQHSNISYRHYAKARQLTLQQLLNLPALNPDKHQQQNIRWKQWFPPLLIAGLLLILLSLTPGRKAMLSNYTILLLIIASGFAPPPLIAAPDTVPKPAQQTMAQDHDKGHVTQSEEGSSYLMHFNTGTACFRAEDFACAKKAFTDAVLRAQTREQKARAIFNLANSYFFLGDYDQAEVLYRDAGIHGIDEKKVATNLSYARDMQQALQRHIQDIRETLRRAQWRAAANGDLPPELDDLLTNDRGMIQPRAVNRHPQAFYQAYRKVFRQQLNTLLGTQENSSKSRMRNWVKTEQLATQSTAALFNRLFEMEIGILAPQAQAQAIRGQRQW